MSGEIKIQKPCQNCELGWMLIDEEDIKTLALDGMFMAVCSTDGLKECRHPWRLLFQAFNESPTAVQQQVLSKVVEIRGRNPEDYNLPKVDKIGTLDL